MKYPITATFIDEITYDIPASNWSNEQWCCDLDNMKNVGIDTLVIMRGVFYNKCIYPSKIFPTLKKENEDFAGLIFSPLTFPPTLAKKVFSPTLTFGAPHTT